MSRPLCVEYPGVFCHITIRGVGKQEIFIKDCDRKLFLEKLGGLQKIFYNNDQSRIDLEHSARITKILDRLDASLFNSTRSGKKIEGNSKNVIRVN